MNKKVEKSSSVDKSLVVLKQLCKEKDLPKINQIFL